MNCNLLACANPHTPATCPHWGVWHNRVRHLQKQWNEWYPLMQHNPVMGENGTQSIARAICERLAPKLYEAKEKLREFEG